MEDQYYTGFKIVLELINDWVTYDISDMKCFKNYKQIINSLPIPDFLAENAAINWIEIMLLQCNDDSEKKMKYEIRADKKNLSIDGLKRRHFVSPKSKFHAVL